LGTGKKLLEGTKAFTLLIFTGRFRIN